MQNRRNFVEKKLVASSLAVDRFYTVVVGRPLLLLLSKTGPGWERLSSRGSLSLP